MQGRNIWSLAYFAAGLETATFICWMNNADPALTKKLLILSCLVEAFQLPRTCAFFYKTYKESKDFIDFTARLELPFVSDLYKNLQPS